MFHFHLDFFFVGGGGLVLLDKYVHVCISDFGIFSLSNRPMQISYQGPLSESWQRIRGTFWS